MLTWPHLVKKYLHFMETGDSFSHSQTPAISSYHKPDQSSPCPHPISWIFNFIISSHPSLGLPSGLFPSGFPNKILYAPLLSPIRIQESNKLKVQKEFSLSAVKFFHLIKIQHGFNTNHASHILWYFISRSVRTRAVWTDVIIQAVGKIRH